MSNDTITISRRIAKDWVDSFAVRPPFSDGELYKEIMHALKEAK